MKSLLMGKLGVILFALVTTITKDLQTSTLTENCTAGKVLAQSLVVEIDFSKLFFLSCLLFFYLYIAIYFLNLSTKIFKRDRNNSGDNTFISLLILAVATILWPVVMPISYLELLKREILVRTE